MATKVANIKGPTGDKGATGASPVGPAGPVAVSTQANNAAVLGTDSGILVPSIPLASTSQKGLLRQVSGNTTDFVDGTNHTQSLATALEPTIWSTRIYSYNAIGNPNFEVDQRNVGGAIANIANGVFAQDRWMRGGSGTFQIKTQQTPTNWTVPGTSYVITSKILTITLTTQETTLAAGDSLYFQQTIEGSAYREIASYHSLSLLVSCSVAPFTFAVALRNTAATFYSLVKSCTLTTTAPTLIQLPNLASWSSNYIFPNAPGVASYNLFITLLSGTTLTAPATDTWQTGNFIAAPGQSNFAALPVNSTFSIGFVQHEPGTVCTPPIDIPFYQNLRACQRYFSKSVPYASAIPTSGSWRQFGSLAQGSTTARTLIRFPVEMAKVPTVTFYDSAGGANAVYIDYVLASTPVTPGSGLFSTQGVGYQVLAAAQTAPYAGAVVFGQWKADTGW